MIDIRNLYKRYHNHHGSDWVLENVSMRIPANVSVGLIGRNGTGKSTLLRLIGGMDAPDRGEIIRNCRVSWPIGLSGGFQGSMTGRQNVKFVARVHGGNALIDDVIAKVESFAEIGEAFDEPVRTYSSGMRARLAFGLSLAFDFDIYLSDEATAVGDAVFRKKAASAFKERVGRSSLIIVSHAEGILKELCQAGILLDGGKATWFNDINEALAVYHQSFSTTQAATAATTTRLPEPANNLTQPIPAKIPANRLNSVLSPKAQTPDILRELAYSLEANGQIPQAHSVISRALELRPDGPLIKAIHKQLTEALANFTTTEAGVKQPSRLQNGTDKRKSVSNDRNTPKADYLVSPNRLEFILSPEAQPADILEELALSLESNGDIASAHLLASRVLEEKPNASKIEVLLKRLERALNQQPER